MLDIWELFSLEKSWKDLNFGSDQLNKGRFFKTNNFYFSKLIKRLVIINLCDELKNNMINEKFFNFIFQRGLWGFTKNGPHFKNSLFSKEEGILIKKKFV